ncbi:MAG: hypothetical protein H6739_37080 [Alphaproteobacteria bacterium]|nr:hypothetical protein [Alphaproteobacteria bacterium]
MFTRVDRWSHGDVLPAALIKLSPEQLADTCGVRLQPDVEPDLGDFLVAEFASEESAFVLAFWLHGHRLGVDLMLPIHTACVEQTLYDVLSWLSLDHHDVRWVAETIQFTRFGFFQVWEMDASSERLALAAVCGTLGKAQRLCRELSSSALPEIRRFCVVS